MCKGLHPSKHQLSFIELDSKEGLPYCVHAYRRSCMRGLCRKLGAMRIAIMAYTHQTDIFRSDYALTSTGDSIGSHDSEVHMY